LPAFSRRLENTLHRQSQTSHLLEGIPLLRRYRARPRQLLPSAALHFIIQMHTHNLQFNGCTLHKSHIAMQRPIPLPSCVVRYTSASKHIPHLCKVQAADVRYS
jgi:hypothetical protein